MHTVLVNVGLVPVPLFSFAPDPTGPLQCIASVRIYRKILYPIPCGNARKMRRAVERFSWLMYEIVLKYTCPVSDIIFCGGLSFHVYSTIRALHLSKTAALHSAVCHHDGVYLHLLRGGRCFRVQLCGFRCLCCREPHYAVSHGVGCRGLHAGYRWQCAGGVHPGSRQRKACQRDLLPADLCAD